MQPGPSRAKALLVERILVTAEPKSAEQWLIEIALSEGWHLSEDDARESAERWAKQFLSLLRNELNSYGEVGRFAPYSFNSSSEYLIQGCAFIEPLDSPDVRTAKLRRAAFEEYSRALRSLTPLQFEHLCAGVLHAMGVEAPSLTTYSADEGIDFFGRLKLNRVLFADDIYPGIQNQLTTWMIGQAKHYRSGSVSTFEIRDLVGAVALAKGKAFGHVTDQFSGLTVRVCDPIFYLFFTTGEMTSNTWRLLNNSGVVGMDGSMLSAFLADRAIGTSDGRFDPMAFTAWIRSFVRP
ncbi:MAG TPA: restriction endonuclease [Candidatus Acidoferrum sp.]|nr:restriction endonuclease [Candidatus Acidoferrum sp.]